jgi:hypothetical protein
MISGRFILSQILDLIHRETLSFERAKKIGIDLNNRKSGDYAAYVDGLDVFINPYAMEFKEAFSFIIKANKLFSYLIIRSVYIACKNFIKRY